MKKITIILWVLGLFSPTLLWAHHEPTPPPTAFIVPVAPIQTTPSVAPIRVQSPVEVIQSTISKLNALTQARYVPQAIQTFASKEVASLFDFNHIAREVLFASRVRLNESEKALFVNRLKQNIITALLSRFSQSNTPSFRFISARPIFGNSIVVNLHLQMIEYPPLSLYVDLLFHQNQNEQWQIFDVVLNNDSLINYYQRVVAVKIRRYGLYGMLENLIK